MIENAEFHDAPEDCSSVFRGELTKSAAAWQSPAARGGRDAPRHDHGRGWRSFLRLSQPAEECRRPPDSSARVPGIVMMQQIFGANAEMRGFTDDYAAQGYVAICPDLFWRLEPGVEIDPLAPDGFQKAVNYAPRLRCRSGRRGSERDGRVPTRASRLQRQDRHGRLLPRRAARLSDGGAQRCGLQCRLFRRADREISRRGGQRCAPARCCIFRRPIATFRLRRRRRPRRRWPVARSFAPIQAPTTRSIALARRATTKT